MADFTLEPHGISVADIHRNATPAFLYEARCKFEKGIGDLVDRRADRVLGQEDRAAARPTSGSSTSPRCATTSGGATSTSSSIRSSFVINRERAIDYLNTRERLYVVDGFAGWDPQYRLKIRVDLRARLPRAVHAQHADPPDARRSSTSFGEPDYVIYNAGELPGEPAHRRA